MIWMGYLYFMTACAGVFSGRRQFEYRKEEFQRPFTQASSARPQQAGQVAALLLLLSHSLSPLQSRVEGEGGVCVCGATVHVY